MDAGREIRSWLLDLNQLYEYIGLNWLQSSASEIRPLEPISAHEGPRSGSVASSAEDQMTKVRQKAPFGFRFLAMRRGQRARLAMRLAAARCRRCCNPSVPSGAQRAARCCQLPAANELVHKRRDPPKKRARRAPSLGRLGSREGHALQGAGRHRAAGARSQGDSHPPTPA